MAGPFHFPVNDIESVKAEGGEIVVCVRRRDGQVLKLTLPRAVEADMKSRLDQLTEPAGS